MCSKKSDAKIEITITTSNLIRINHPLSNFNYHLSGANVANFNKIHCTVSEQQLFKKWTQKQKFPIWKSRLSSPYTLTSLQFVLWILSQQLLYANKTLDFVCFGQFLGLFLLKALKFQVLVNDSRLRHYSQHFVQ